MFNFPVLRRDRSDNLLDNLFRSPLRFALADFDSLPAVDIYEKADKVTVRAEVPGVKPEDLKVSLDQDLLTISGEKRQENECKEQDYYQLESAYGRLERTVKLPDSVKAEGAKAVYKNGVLKIDLQKSREQRKKSIKIDVN